MRDDRFGITFLGPLINLTRMCKKHNSREKNYHEHHQGKWEIWQQVGYVTCEKLELLRAEQFGVLTNYSYVIRITNYHASSDNEQYNERKL